MVGKFIRTEKVGGLSKYIYIYIGSISNEMNFTMKMRECDS